MAMFVTMIKMIKVAFNEIKCIFGHIFATMNSIIKHEPPNGQNTDSKID